MGVATMWRPAGKGSASSWRSDIGGARGHTGLIFAALDLSAIRGAGPASLPCPFMRLRLVG